MADREDILRRDLEKAQELAALYAADAALAEEQLRRARARVVELEPIQRAAEVVAEMLRRADDRMPFLLPQEKVAVQALTDALVDAVPAADTTSGEA